MHPYRMQRLIEQRGKDRVVNVRERASLYQTIERLSRLGLIAVWETVRGDKHPDRIVYAITDQGRETARQWLIEILRATGADYPDFPAGVSVLTLLTADDACAQFEARTGVGRGARRGRRATPSRRRSTPLVPPGGGVPAGDARSRTRVAPRRAGRSAHRATDLGRPMAAGGRDRINPNEGETP